MEGIQTATPRLKLVDHFSPVDDLSKLLGLYERQHEQPCIHAMEDEAFLKKGKVALEIEYPAKLQKDSDVQRGCILCYAKGFQAGFSAIFRHPNLTLKDVPDIPQMLIGTVSFKIGLALGFGNGAKKEEDGEWSWPLIALYGDQHQKHGFNFHLEYKQYGELFHILFAKLLQPPTSVTNDKAGDLFSIFPYYKIKDAKNPVADAKDKSTAMISNAFARSTNEQDKLFTAFRLTLERLHIPEMSALTGIVPKSLEYYCSISYLGKFWINRFLTLTGQGVSKRDGQRSQLPKKDGVSRIALIHIRKQGNGASGRSMTDGNIKVCLEAIALANSKAAFVDANSPAFSHILFFGDFKTMHEGLALKELVSNTEGLTDLSDSNILYITEPWMSTEDQNDPVQRFWALFQTQSEDYSTRALIYQDAPLQARYMAMFLALQARYKDSLCAIGFRCGYLDLAAFIGIPTFFVDAAWTEHSLETLIYLPANNTTRMVAASNNINTFIRIDFVAPRSGSTESQPANNVQVKFDSKAKQEDKVKPGDEAGFVNKGLKERGPEQLWDMKTDGLAKKGEVHVGDRLAAALYIFMLANLPQPGPLWKRRVELLKQEWITHERSKEVEDKASTKVGDPRIKKEKGPLQMLLEVVIPPKR